MIHDHGTGLASSLKLQKKRKRKMLSLNGGRGHVSLGQWNIGAMN
jgi:hypothetical protein